MQKLCILAIIKMTSLYAANPLLREEGDINGAVKESNAQLNKPTEQTS